MKIVSITKCCLLALLLSTSTMKSQDAIVEKSIYGIQTGFWGIWGYNESKLSSKLALRTEVGLFDYLGLIDGINLEPVVTLEPRWYFNLERRLAKGKRIDANIGSFVALKISLKSNVFTIPRDQYYEPRSTSLSFVPTIGGRRNIGKNFNYELGFGLGLAYYIQGLDSFRFPEENPEDEKIGVVFNIHLRIGYNL